MNRAAFRAAGVTLLLLLQQAFAAERSTVDPLRIRIGYDPQVPSFYPGNAGDWTFRKKPAPQKSPYSSEELKSDGYVIELEAGRYDFHAWDKPASGEGSDFRRQLRGMLSNSSFLQAVFDCRINDALLRKLRERGRAEQFVENFAWACRDVPLPLVSFDTENARAAAGLRDDFRTTVPGLLIGRVMKSGDFSREEISGWDFIIARPSQAPPQYRGQAAVSYFRSRAPGIPIFFAVKKPDLLAQMFWLTTGAAGFYHDELSGDGKSESTDWKHVRAFTAFKPYVPPNAVPLPGVSGPGVLGAFGVAGRAVFLVGDGQEDIRVKLPASARLATCIGRWYNAETDQQIVLPRTTVPRDSHYQLEPPARGKWLYAHAFLPAESDRDTTMPKVVIDPDFDLIGEADNELSTGPAVGVSEED